MVGDDRFEQVPADRRVGFDQLRSFGGFSVQHSVQFVVGGLHFFAHVGVGELFRRDVSVQDIGRCVGQHLEVKPAADQLFGESRRFLSQTLLQELQRVVVGFDCRIVVHFAVDRLKQVLIVHIQEGGVLHRDDPVIVGIVAFYKANEILRQFRRLGFRILLFDHLTNVGVSQFCLPRSVSQHVFHPCVQLFDGTVLFAEPVPYVAVFPLFAIGEEFRTLPANICGWPVPCCFLPVYFSRSGW